MIIYVIFNTVNDKIYIGKTSKSIELRFRQHILNSKSGQNTGLYRAFRKYGLDKFRILHLSDSNSEPELTLMEIELIDLFKSNNPKFGYNMTKGGDGGAQTDYRVRNKLSKSISESHSRPEVKAKMSLAKLGIPLSNYRAEKLKQSNIGREMPKHVKEALRSSNLGRKLSKKSRLKISNSKKGKKLNLSPEERARRINFLNMVRPKHKQKN